MDKIANFEATSFFAPPGAIDLVVSDVVEMPVIPTSIAVKIPDFQNT
jgi:hypothetical protein